MQYGSLLQLDLSVISLAIYEECAVLARILAHQTEKNPNFLNSARFSEAACSRARTVHVAPYVAEDEGRSTDRLDIVGGCYLESVVKSRAVALQ